jgi:predicted permease
MEIMSSILHDLKYAFRLLAKSPGFTAVAIITLALGIGATTAIFSVVSGVLLSPLPFPNPSRLVILQEKSSTFPTLSISYPNFLDWQRQQRSFSALAIYRDATFNLAERSGAEVVSARMVSASFCKVLGLSPNLGRSFTAQDNHLGAGRTVILSYRFWQRHFGGSPAILGKLMTMDNEDYAIIGVLPKSFWFFEPRDVYVPVGIFNREWRTNRKMHDSFSAVGRLRPGVTLGQARADMANVASRLDRQYPEDDAGVGVTASSMPSYVVRDIRPMLVLLLGAVCLVLLIACVNVANLLLSRSTAREKEMAIRAALGAARTRVVRQLLTESVLLAFLGGALGVALAYWGTHSLLAYVPQELPRAQNVGIDLRVLLFVAAVSVITGLLFGLAPAFRSSSIDLHDGLQESSRGTTGGRHALQDGLVIAEVGLALVLLAGAGLTLRTILHLYRVKTGFATSGSLVFEVSLPRSRYQSGPVDRAFYREVVARIRSLPGVRGVGAANNMPMTGGDSEIDFYVQGRSKPQTQNMPWAMFYLTTPGYFHAMDISLLRGRFFTDDDTVKTQSVVVIDDELARKVFHGQNPLGQHIILPFEGLEAPREIVGVVHHVRHFGPAGQKWTQRLVGAFYMPFAQLPDVLFKGFGAMNLTLVARTSVDPESMIASVKRTVHGIDNSVAINDVHTMGDLLRLSIAAQRLTALLLGLFAALALILAAVGIYGVISYSVTRRTHEIGIRMALGAEKRHVLLWVIGRGMTLALAGLVGGVIVALFATRLLADLLSGVGATDPLTFAIVSVVLLSVALLACFIPARRAASVDPMVALRYE